MFQIPAVERHKVILPHHGSHHCLVCKFKLVHYNICTRKEI